MRSFAHLPSLDAAQLAAGQRALHVEDGGTWITTGHRVLRLRPQQELVCSTCRGHCPVRDACFQPEPAPARRRLHISPETAGAVIGALLGLAGAAAMAVRMHVI